MKTALALLSVVSALAVTAAVFPLPNPTRPAGFPLNRPALTGKVVAWGANDVGQTNIQAGLRDVVALAAGEEHTVALTADGKVVAWGANNLGQCNVPLDLNGVVAIAASGSFSLALRNDGRVFAWGHGGNGQLLVPVELNDAVAIAAAPSHAIALRLNGAVVAWGDGAAFEQAPPYPAVAIAGSTRRTLAIRDDSSISGRVDEWGTMKGTIPGGLSGAVRIASGLSFSCALKSDGTLALWGAAGGSVISLPEGVSGVTGIAAGYQHVVCLKADGTVMSFGVNTSGQTNVPPNLSRVIGVAAGARHSLALVGDGLAIPNRATAQAEVMNGFVVGVKLLNPGQGYTEPPLVLIRGGNGAGATAVATIAGGAVTGFTITNPGSGYTQQPSVSVASPPFAPEASVEVSRVKVSLRVVLGRKYQIQSSRNLEDWAVAEPEFTADSENIVREFSVEEAGRHFRVVELP